MNTPHKHAEVIKAWADGAEIEYRVKCSMKGWSEWKIDDSPRFLTDPWWEFRVKQPTKREWFGLDEVDTYQLWKDTPLLIGVYTYADVAKEVEALLKEKNT